MTDEYMVPLPHPLFTEHKSSFGLKRLNKITQNNKSTEYDKYKQQIQTNHFKYSI